MKIFDLRTKIRQKSPHEVNFRQCLQHCWYWVKTWHVTYDFALISSAWNIRNKYNLFWATGDKIWVPGPRNAEKTTKMGNFHKKNTVSFWFLTIICSIWHIILLQIAPSKWMKAGKVLRGHWSDLGAHIGLPKSLKCLETDNICHISWYNEQYILLLK